jgi:hypothetical protein
LTTIRDFVAWLATQPGGTPFHLGLVTETAVRGYMDSLVTGNRAPRTRSKALSALRRFCQWAVDESHLRRNPARSIERPTVVAMAPRELSDKQRFVLKTMVEQQVFTTLTQDLSEEQRKQLDTLLVVPTDGRRTPLAWLREPPGPAKPSSFLKVIERLQYIRSFGLDPLLARRVHANRLRRLAHEGEQYTPQFLERFEPLRRYATLVAYLLDITATLTDTALEMHDHIMGLLFKQGQKKQLAQFEQRGKAINEKVRLYADDRDRPEDPHQPSFHASA